MGWRSPPCWPCETGKRDLDNATAILERLRRLMQRLNHGQGFVDSARLVTDSAASLFGCNAATLWVLDESGHEPLLFDCLCSEQAGVPLGSGWAGWAFAQDEPAWLDDASYLPHHPTEVFAGPGSLAAVPIVLARERLGVLVLHFAHPRGVEPEQMMLIELLAYSVASCLERARYRPIDPRSGLLRRDILIPRLRQEMERQLGEAPELTVLVLGLDQLSGAGEARHQVMAAASQRIRARTRKRDPLSLYTGDRFALIMPGASSRVGWSVAERIRESMREPIALEDGQMLRQTLSVGVAGWDGQCSARALMGRASEAQKTAAARGGNAVELTR